ncbi:MAG: hypothetical protein AB1324_06845 [Candidatus Micrarchaeota archaeon]
MFAQMSPEFMVVYTALLTISLVVLLISFGSGALLSQAGDTAAAKRDALALASAVNYVYLAGEGASVSIEAGGGLEISDYAVTATRGDAVASSPLLHSGAEEGAVAAGNITITNMGGAIDISQ